MTRAIGFREHATPKDAATNPTYWAPAHRPSDNPGPGNRTDLASVPWLFWSFIASSGRQSAPAILHDHQSEVALALPASDALRQRREDDRLFRVGLRQQKVPVRFALMLVEAVAGGALPYVAVILGIGHPLWLLLLLVPAVVSLVWGPEALLVSWGNYSIAVLALQIVALIPFWILEVAVRELIDRPFVDHHASTELGPFFRTPR